MIRPFQIRPAATVIAVLTTAATMTGCSSNTDRMLDQAFGFNCVASDSMVGEWICSGNDAAVATVSRYCYETLGEVNCFDRPDPDRRNLPQGSSGF